jgi:hypothetical protein
VAGPGRGLTIPVATVLGLADRPDELGSVGPIDPALARDLAAAAARNPRTTWCVTVTDGQGHAIGHGCARPAPRSSHVARPEHGAPGGPGPPGFAFTATGQPGPPGGYGTWRLATGAPGTPDLIVALHPIATDTCDHRFEAAGHDPGTMLRHLTPGPARHLHRPGLPPTLDPRRLRTHPVRGRRSHLRMQRKRLTEVPPSAAPTTGSSRTRDRRSNRSPRPPSGGQPPRAGSTKPSPRAIRFSQRAHRYNARCRLAQTVPSGGRAPASDDDPSPGAPSRPS